MATRQDFRAFTVKANGRLDHILTEIEVRPGFDPNKPPSPIPPAIKTRALWDTGASKSVISTSLAQSLGLTPVSTREVHHGDGKSLRNVFMVNFDLPNAVHVAGILATEFPPSHNNFNVLVGMDVIGLGDLALTHVGGLTTFSFRVPSCEAVDYVLVANRQRFAGASRNGPCPCGSGKKFKFCHLPSL